jgi:hypothetical protein
LFYESHKYYHRLFGSTSSDADAVAVAVAVAFAVAVAVGGGVAADTTAVFWLDYLHPNSILGIKILLKPITPILRHLSYKI